MAGGTPQTVGELIFTGAHGTRASNTALDGDGGGSVDLGGGWIEPASNTTAGERQSRPLQHDNNFVTQPSQMQQLQLSIQMYAKDRRDDGAILTPLLMSRSHHLRCTRVSKRCRTPRSTALTHLPSHRSNDSGSEASYPANTFDRETGAASLNEAAGTLSWQTYNTAAEL